VDLYIASSLTHL